MWRVEREYLLLPRYPCQCLITPIIVEALQKIVGVVPAFMRPRKCLLPPQTFTLGLHLATLPAYGNYNDLVRQASAVRGQSLVIWDFECVMSRCEGVGGILMII